jgi:acetyl-CoA acyltransferase
VIPSAKAPNLGREAMLGAGLPPAIPASTVNRACASASQAIADVASAILLSHVDCGIAGGAESLSDVPILHSRNMGPGARHGLEGAQPRSAALGLRGRPAPGPGARRPAIAEPSTGLTMGQSAEKMAEENGITRERAGHHRLPEPQERRAKPPTTAPARGDRAPVFVPPKYETAVTADNLLRRDTSLEALLALPPVFDRTYGTVTAGNSSPLTDGAAAVC